MNRKYRFLIPIFGFLSLSIISCQKKSSTSSATGSVSQAAGNLAALAFTGSGVTPASITPGGVRVEKIKPAWVNCMAIGQTTTISPLASGNSTCPNSSDNGWQIVATVTMQLSSCATAGYTFSGGLALSVSSETICYTSLSNSIDYLSGAVDLTAPTNISITGNGLPASDQTCSISIPMTLSSANGAASAVSSSGATACSQPVSVNL